jgi:glutamine amidotransferase
MWTDASFASLAPTVDTACFLAAVRCATPGSPVDESCTAPFTYWQWLFSHNGQLADHSRVRKMLCDGAEVPDALAGVDSAFLFSLAVARWQAGAALADGLAGVVSDVAVAGGGRLNLLATDGQRLAATVSGDSLFVRAGGGSVLLASEPLDDQLGWTELPPDSLVDAGLDGITVTALGVVCP